MRPNHFNLRLHSKYNTKTHLSVSLYQRHAGEKCAALVPKQELWLLAHNKH
jgi:hypothetical protein